MGLQELIRIGGNDDKQGHTFWRKFYGAMLRANKQSWILFEGGLVVFPLGGRIWVVVSASVLTEGWWGYCAMTLRGVAIAGFVVIPCNRVSSEGETLREGGAGGFSPEGGFVGSRVPLHCYC
jgi:hypothetical protein